MKKICLLLSIMLVLTSVSIPALADTAAGEVTTKSVTEDKLDLETVERKEVVMEKKPEQSEVQVTTNKTSPVPEQSDNFDCIVLVAEDHPINQKLLKTFLTSFGCTVFTANNGREAVNQIAEHPEVELVFMDVQMPVMDGYEATKVIRNMSNRILAHTPIIAMTANAFEEEKKKALAYGMNGHVSKPIDINVLFKTIEGIIK